MGRDDGDTLADLVLFRNSNEETDLEPQLAVDSEPICEFCASPNPASGSLMLSICPPRVDCGPGWFLASAVCESAELTVVDKAFKFRCTEAAS